MRELRTEQRAKPATRKEMAQFHTDEYVDFLSRVTPDLVEAAAEGNGGNKTAGLAREMGRCKSSFQISSQLGVVG